MSTTATAEHELLETDVVGGPRQQHEPDRAVLRERLVLAELLRGQHDAAPARDRAVRADAELADDDSSTAHHGNTPRSASTANPPSTISLSATGSRNAPDRVAPSRRASQPSRLSLAVIANHSPTVSHAEPRLRMSASVGTATAIRLSGEEVRGRRERVLTEALRRPARRRHGRRGHGDTFASRSGPSTPQTVARTIAPGTGEHVAAFRPGARRRRSRALRGACGRR